jgi:amino acid transporter
MLTAEDEQQLKLLSILHYVMAGLMALFACFPIVHFVLGGMMLVLPFASSDPAAGAPPAIVGGMFMLIAGAFMVLGWAWVACLVVAARSLAQRRRRVFCMVVGGMMAATCVPLGTMLGIFTIIVLQRPSVTQAFDSAA